LEKLLFIQEFKFYARVKSFIVNYMCDFRSNYD